MGFKIESTPCPVCGHTDMKSVKILDHLSPRTKEIAMLMLEGFKTKEIARQLNVEVRAVKAHLSKLYRTINIDHRLYLPHIRIIRILWEEKYGTVPWDESVNRERIENNETGCTRIQQPDNSSVLWYD